MNTEAVRLARVFVRNKLNETASIRVCVVQDLVTLAEKQQAELSALRLKVNELSYQLGTCIETAALSPERAK